MSKSKIYRRGYRIRKAYGTAFRVAISYLWLHWKSKVFGKKYYENRIFDLHVRNAERVKKAILQLQGLFIKVGQLLSILSNFLPKAFQEHLEELQNNIPGEPYEYIQKRIIKELGDSPENLFSEFDKIPLASASIGQVHRAKLKSGEDIVVKIQHQNIEEIAEVDLNIMQKLVKLNAYFFDIKGMEHAYTQVRKMVEEELDFRKEAKSMQLIAENLKDEPQLKIPTIHEQFCTERVLTSEYVEGIKISDVQQIESWNIDRTDLANRLVHAYCKMVFEDGFYHADPHPGNIMVQQDGTIIFLDFGAVAHLKENMRTGMLALIDAAVKNDNEKIVNALRQMEFLAEGKDAEKAAEKIIDAFRHFIQNEVQLDGLNFQDIKVNPFESSLFNLTKELGIRGITNTVQVPKEFVLLNRMVTLLLGICSTLDTQMNPIKEVQPYLQKYILGEQGNMTAFFTDLIKSNLTNVLSLPGELYGTLKKAQRGELEVQIQGMDTLNRSVRALGRQFILTILLITSSTFTYLFYQNGIQRLENIGMFVSGIIGFILVRSLWRNRK